MLVNDPGAAHFEIDPARLDLVAEFKANPRGPHSRDLQKVLHRMRWGCVGGRFALIILEPGRRWMLALIPEARGEPIRRLPDRIYDDPNKAEWDVFKLRWKLLTGQDLKD